MAGARVVRLSTDSRARLAAYYDQFSDVNSFPGRWLDAILQDGSPVRINADHVVYAYRSPTKEE